MLSLMLWRRSRPFVLVSLTLTLWLLVAGVRLGVIPRWIPTLKNAILPDQGKGVITKEFAAHDVLNRAAGFKSQQTNVGSLPDVSNVHERVLVLATARTGSSFVGELLGSSKDVFYLFEPGFGLQATFNQLPDKVRKHYNLIDLYLDMLWQLYRCDFRYLDYYLKFLTDYEGVQALKRRGPKLYEACSRQSHNDSCLLTQNMATKSCKESKYIVFKAIRIEDINLLLPMIEDKAVNLKVIHLVRDPRPMTLSFARAIKGQSAFSSSKRNGTGLSTSSQALLKNYCKHNLANLEMGQRSLSSQQRYMFLRYEDVASDPVSAAGRMYKFLGDDHLPESVLSWINANTNASQPGLFGTKKNSRETYQAWRRTLPFEVAKLIEEVGQCRRMMTRMGYRLLEDEKHLRNFSRSLIDDIA